MVLTEKQMGQLFHLLRGLSPYQFDEVEEHMEYLKRFNKYLKEVELEIIKFKM